MKVGLATVNELLAEAVKEPLRLKFRHESRDAHDGQVDMTCFAVDAENLSKPYGYVDYSIFRGEVHIEMVEVPPRYQRYHGIAARMLLSVALENDTTWEAIHKGWQTDEGAKLVTFLNQNFRGKSKKEIEAYLASPVEG